MLKGNSTTNYVKLGYNYFVSNSVILPKMISQIEADPVKKDNFESL